MWIEVKGLDQTWIPIHSTLLLRRPQFTLEKLKQGMSYTAWTNIEYKKLNAELKEIEKHIHVMIQKPVFTVIIDIRQNLTDWEKTLMAVQKQIYACFEVRYLVNSITDVPSFIAQDIKFILDMTLMDVKGDFIIFINSNQHLSRIALYEFANVVNQYPDLVYGDEDFLNEFGERCNPFHKPDWSPDYLETFNYIGFTACFRTSIARGCIHNPELYDFVLRFTECTTNIFHIPKILGHTQQTESHDVAIKNISELNILALQGRINRTERQGVVREHELHSGCYDIELSIKLQPLISIIIPTAGKVVTVGERQIDLITNVIEQIRSRSTYKKIEIIVVDNGDLSCSQEQSIADLGCKKITFTEPIFNISKKLNLGVSIADGEYLLLMNDDIEIITPNWIERMLEHFEKPHVGVVGAKLLYTDNLIQHVGVVHNNGNPDHVRRLYSKNDSGYFFSSCGVRNFMAVTGAAMMTLKNIYNSVGGYSEELAVSYNDIDYCLKVREVGLYIVYAPRVELIHMESQSRIASANMGEVAWYHNRWADHTSVDPYYNELFLTVASPTFVPFVNLRKI
jgi:GT2 family glycosyltransferase